MNGNFCAISVLTLSSLELEDVKNLSGIR